jgi:large subunit ribosomal protein L6
MYSKELVIPQDVTLDVSGNKVKVSGAKGQLEKEFRLTNNIKIEKIENKIKVSSESERRKVKALVGTILAHIRNAIEGVMKGYTYKLKVVFSHFPVTVKLEGNKLLIQNFLGERKPRAAKIVGDTKVEINGADITVTGIDIDEVGETAHNLELATRRTGFDKKVFQDGIYLVSRGE